MTSAQSKPMKLKMLKTFIGCMSLLGTVHASECCGRKIVLPSWKRKGVISFSLTSSPLALTAPSTPPLYSVDGFACKQVDSLFAFIPRGGAKSVGGKKLIDEPTDDISSPSKPDEGPADGGVESATSADKISSSSTTFNREKRSRELDKEAVKAIRKDQQFLEKQRKRRLSDKTWLDKGITGVVEFLENFFRWKLTY